MILPSGPYRGGGGDPHFANVSLLLHGNGTNGGTSFPDSSSNNFTVTPIAGAKTSTAQSKFGGSSMAFNGTTDYLSVASAAPLNLGGTDWTVEFWIYMNSQSGVQGPVTKRQPNNDAGWNLYTDNNVASIYSNTAGSFGASGHVIPNGTWSFIAYSKNTGNLFVYVDGVLAGNGGSHGDIADNPYALFVGSGRNDEYYLNGYMAEVRITKGVARYVGSSCPIPSAPFPDF